MPMLVSPNQMMVEAKREMLDSREPESLEDHIKIMQFLAVNVHREVALPACKLMVLLYDMPLDDATVERIVGYYTGTDQPVI